MTGADANETVEKTSSAIQNEPDFSDVSNIPLIDTRLNDSLAKDSHLCPHCSFRTAWKSSLTIHLKTHTDERPWQCALCNKHFKLKHHLKHHILTHSTIKPFKCNICNYRTAVSRNMQRHKYNKHRPTLKRRGPEKLSLPSMVSSSHANFDAVSSFVEKEVSVSQSVANTPPVTTTPSFRSSVTSLAFQSPTSFNVSTASQQPRTQKDPNSFRQQTPTVLTQNVLDSIQSARPSTFYYVSEEKMNESLQMSSPESVTFIKEELPEGRIEHRSLTSERSFDMSQTSNVSESLSPPPIDTDINISNIISRSQKICNSVASDASDTPASTPKKQNPTVIQSTKQTERSKWKCKHCEIIFPDNIMYGLHMGCHSVTNEYQCNICGASCKDKHDFMFHLTIGRHQT